WWLNRPMVIRHPAFGTDCSELVAKADLDHKVDCIRVWYGTNRLLITDDTFSTGDTVDVTAGLGESGDQLSLGRADVWLPKLVEQGGSRTRGETPHVQGSAPDDADRLAEYVFLTRITSNGQETFATTLQDAIDGDRSDSILLFIHGFNVQFDEALVRAAQLSNDLSRENRFNVGVPVLYSWPSAGALSLEDYQGDRSRSLSAAPYLEEFLDILTEDVSVSRINIIAHSMGNRVLTQALEDYARDYLERHDRGDELEFRILLVAADVERDIFAAANGVFDNLDANVTIYTSDTDRALHISNIVNSNQAKRLGDTDTNRPYIRPSLNYQTIDATAVTTELFGIGHNYYSDNPTILWDMMCTIRETPPQNRALEMARFGDLPNGDPYFRINATINPNASECTLHRTAFPAGDAPIPPTTEGDVDDGVSEDEIEIMPEAMPAPAPPPPRSMAPPAQSYEPDAAEAPDQVLIEFLVDSYDEIDLTPHINALENGLDPNRPILSIQIFTASDTVGSADDNLTRTEAYADAIGFWFIERGVDPGVILAQGLGESQLTVDTPDETAEPLNRRAAVLITYMN
ncbi:MAG: alpha/beta hydrolase, partial [Pseudomonadota bacterium]